MSQRVQSHEAEVQSRGIAPQQRHLLAERAAVAAAGAMVVVAAMATGRWQTAQPRMVGLFGCRGPARQAAIGVELDAHAARISQAENSDQVRQDLAAVWRLELAALLRQHPQVEDQLRTLIVQVCEGLPTAQQTWVRTNIIRSHNASPLAEKTIRACPGPTD
jgi:mRNA degradation ribonuclease J1/J2